MVSNHIGDREVEHELVEQAQMELGEEDDGQERGAGVKDTKRRNQDRKKKKELERIEAEEDLEEESPAPGYPNETVIPLYP